MENKESFNKQEIITAKDNLPSILKEIGIQREKKGTSEILIPYIRKVRQEVEKTKDFSSVVQLYQEEFLSAQHMVMEEKNKKLKANPLRIAKGMLTMENTSKTMERYIVSDNKSLDPVVKARVYRFLGRYTDYKGQFKKSEVYYKKGLEYFDQTTKPEERFNRLEFLGFLSYSLIKQGSTQEGLNLAKNTLKDFDESSEGKWLKENNYYAWAVWKSGVEIRTASDILKKKDLQNTDLAKNFLKDSENILRMPDGSTESFSLRLDELNTAKKLIKK